MRLLLDEMYPRRLAERLRAGGHDVVAVVEVPDLVGQPDAEVVRWAAEAGRLVVTENIVDYASLDWAGHAGVLLVNARRRPRTPAGTNRLDAAISAWLRSPAADRRGPVGWL